MANIAMLGTGLIGMFYTMSLQAKRGRDKIVVVCGHNPEKTQAFATKWGIPSWTTDYRDAIQRPDVDIVVVGLPNNLHKEVVVLAAQAGKAIFCTKPLGRNAAEAKEMLDAVEKAGVFHGYLEDLVYTPKTLKSVQSVKNGSIGKVLWTRSRETHPGPHSDWFWKKELSRRRTARWAWCATPAVRCRNSKCRGHFAGGWTCATKSQARSARSG